MKKKPRKIFVILLILLLLLLIGAVSYFVIQSGQNNAHQMEPPTFELPPSVSDIEDGDIGKWETHPSLDIPDPKESEPSGNTSDSSKKPAPNKPVSPGKPVPPVKPAVPVIPTEPTPAPSEPGKPTDPTKPPVKPDRPSGGGSGGSVSYPAAAVEIIVPEYSHADLEFEVKTVLRNVKSLSWTVTEDGEDTPSADFLKGTLDKDGGKVTITKPGVYTLTATVKNYGGRTYTFAKSIRIHPIFEITVETERYTHTDLQFEVKTTLSDHVNQQLNWHIYKNGNEVKWQDTVTGVLTNAGGTIQIKEKGSYTLKAVAFDETSREFFGKSEVQVLPIVEITPSLPKFSHTDTFAAASVSTKELGGLPLRWSVSKDGDDAVFADYIEGALTNEGGSIRFKEKGSYHLTASVTDQSGRTFSGNTDIKVYPVSSFTFSLPATVHTDKKISVEVTASELQDMQVEWSLLFNGKLISQASVLEGTLSNTGGTIRFKEKGVYVLKATLFDATGREYSHEASTTVYPVAETGFYLPAMTHTDTVVEVKTSFKETAGLTAVWSLTKDGKPTALVDGFVGTLSNDGGKIRFLGVGSYELMSTVTDSSGRSFTYTSPVKVYPVIKLSMELPDRTHTDRPVAVTLTGENMGTLPVVWSAVRDTVPADVVQSLGKQGGTLAITEKGVYTIAASVTDEAGRTFRTEEQIKVYPVPVMSIRLPEAAHTDDTLSLDIKTKDMEELTAVWYVDNTHGFQDWATYIEGTLENTGGSIRFKRAGVYDLEARAIDATGRIFRFDSNKIEILPVLQLSFGLPATAHTDTKIDVRTRGNNSELPIEWSLLKDGKSIPLEQALSGSLNVYGGKISFTSAGEYRLTATMFDALGRVFTASQKISIYPLYNCSFTMPSSIHAGQNFVVAPGSGSNLGGKHIVWTVTKDGKPAPLSALSGTLTNSGGTVHVDAVGSYALTATISDELGRSFTHTQTIGVTNTAPTKPTLSASVTRTYLNGKFLVNLSVSGTDPDGDAITYEYESKAGDNYYALGVHTVRARAKDNFGGVSDWATATFTVANSAPTRPAATASVNRNQQQNGKFLVTLSVNSTDADGDAITYEYQNKASDNYYPIGTHTVQVRAKDNYGGISDWAAVTFTVANSAPSRPVITRSPNTNSVVPGTPVTITASSTDPDGDPITYIWDGRGAQTATYPMGKNTVRVKAVDSTGAESPWAAIVFFVMDNNGSGGMMLTGPNSTINENGIEGATITNYTFTVPPVSGHNGDDYGRVRGYNVKTGQWDQLDYGTTNNGISFTRSLTPGVYSQLEMYYYTNHSCMYNKSNITYTVSYYFE